MSARAGGEPPKSGSDSGLLGPVAVFFAVAAVFLPSLRNGFVEWDDHVAILGNPHLRGLGWEHLRWMFSTFLLGPYQPLAWVSLALDAIVWGMNPAGFHLTSLVIHAVNAALFYALSARLLGLGFSERALRHPATIRMGAAAAALLFGLHPLRVESVVWATERRDVLAGMFFMLTLLAYVPGGGMKSGGREDPLRLFMAVGFFFLALLSKASVMTLPALLLLLDIYPLRRLPADPRRWRCAEAWPVLREKVAFVLLGLAFAAIAIYGQGKAHAMRSLAESSPGDRIAIGLYSTGFYCWKTLVPFRLSPLYQVPQDLSVLSFSIGASGVWIVIATVAGVLLRTRAPAMLTSWLAFLILLAPASGIVRVGTQIAADRYSYLPCLGFALLAGAGLAIASDRGSSAGSSGGDAQVTRFAPALAGLLAVGFLAFLTLRQIPVWRDSLSLWSHGSRMSPESSIAHYSLGDALSARERTAEAIAEYRQAIALDSSYTDARNNLGTLLAACGQSEAARAEFLIIERMHPNSPAIHYNLGIVAGILGETDEAVSRYRTSLALNPALSVARINLAQILAQHGSPLEARKVLLDGMSLSPADSSLIGALRLFNLEAP